jgi:hypothetical protein
MPRKIFHEYTHQVRMSAAGEKDGIAKRALGKIQSIESCNKLFHID